MKDAGMIPHYALNARSSYKKHKECYISTGDPKLWQVDCDILSLMYR